MMMPSIFRDRTFDDLFDFPRMDFPEMTHTMPKASQMMRTDVREKEDHFEIDIDLPGYTKDDVTAELKDGYLTVSATKNESNDEKDEKGSYIRRERFYGSMQRSYYVGDAVDEGDIKAKFENGILSLSVPKEEPKKVEDKRRLVTIEG